MRLWEDEPVAYSRSAPCVCKGLGNLLSGGDIASALSIETLGLHLGDKIWMRANHDERRVGRKGYDRILRMFKCGVRLELSNVQA